MREILFRGQNSRSKKWIYGYFNGRENSFARIIDTYNITRLVNPETVGQYTGMTDKNGNKIFEGDIISTSSKLIGAVEWNNTFAKYIVCYNQISGNWFDFEGEDCFSVALDCVIIGNVHDNPELLEGKA